MLKLEESFLKTMQLLYQDFLNYFQILKNLIFYIILMWGSKKFELQPTYEY